jgi:AAA domain-containing protein
VTRICITGGPRTGKTTLAGDLEQAGLPAGLGTLQHPARWTVRHTDDLIEQCKHLGRDAWSEASRIASTWLDEPGPWIIEGVAVSRALRKWRDAHPGEPPPVDKIVRLTTPHEPLSKGQAAMAKGEETVWQEIAGWLLSEGVTVDPLSSVDV